MAWRIHEHILRGELDNSVRRRVTGRIWLDGVAEPLVLDLDGDCHPDLAGCVLTFENPAPVPMTTRPPAAQQRGTAGDITAARKVRVFDLPVKDAYMMLKRGEKPPEHMANALYIEWFSERSGRVVIESTDYRLTVSEPAWRFTAEELAARERQREEGSDAFAIEIQADGTVREWDEFRNEQLLRESDMTTEKYARLIEKYGDHPDAERLIAHEMGWDRLDEEPDEEADAAEAEEIARMNEICEAALDEPEPEPDPAREGIDWVRDREERIMHPVAQHARDVLYALLDELKAGGEDLAETDEAVGNFAAQLMTLHVKLCSALGFIARDRGSTDRGLIIAWLKRALEIHNETLSAAGALDGHGRLPAERLAHYRAELFQIREAVLAIIAGLRAGG
jgi:hypothetical protein